MSVCVCVCVWCVCVSECVRVMFVIVSSFPLSIPVCEMNREWESKSLCNAFWVYNTNHQRKNDYIKIITSYIS